MFLVCLKHKSGQIDFHILKQWPIEEIELKIAAFEQNRNNANISEVKSKNIL